MVEYVEVTNTIFSPSGLVIVLIGMAIGSIGAIAIDSIGVLEKVTLITGLLVSIVATVILGVIFTEEPNTSRSAKATLESVQKTYDVTFSDDLHATDIIPKAGAYLIVENVSYKGETLPQVKVEHKGGKITLYGTLEGKPKEFQPLPVMSSTDEG